jgi:hypothetical protein
MESDYGYRVTKASNKFRNKHTHKWIYEKQEEKTTVTWLQGACDRLHSGAFLLEGVAWYVTPLNAKRVVGILRMAQQLRVIIVFVDSKLLTLFSLQFSFI